MSGTKEPNSPVQTSPQAASSPSPAMAPLSPDTVEISGTWQVASLAETWTLAPLGGERYQAVGRGSGNAAALRSS